MSRVARAVAIVVALLGGAGGGARAAAAGGACPEAWEPSGGPLPGGDLAADFGAIPEACPGSDIAARLRGALLIASAKPDFYGSAIVGTLVRARHTIGPRAWFSLALDTATFRYVNNGGVPSSGFSVGPPTAGVGRLVGGAGPSLALALYARALLPLDTARQTGIETGLETGATARARLRGRAGVEGGLALVAPLDVIGGQLHGHLWPVALAEAWWTPRPWLGLFAGASARGEAAPDPALVTIVPRVAARFALRHQISLAVLIEAPVAGRDRTDLVTSFFASWAP
jgi:hypothetical protein